ncbi:hypothetical protein RB195_016104 [Necator americanus]
MISPSSEKSDDSSPRRSRHMRRRTIVSNPYAEINQQNNFYTSTPHRSFYPMLPPISTIYTPFSSYYSRFELSGYSADYSDPSTSLNQRTTIASADRCSPPPQLVPYSTPLSDDSGFSSTASGADSTPVTRSTVRGYKKTYCTICKVNINKEGKRSQGPRRHLLQHHVRRPLFQCPHCSHSSFYDKFHVTSHMRRIHQDHSDRLINRSSEFEDEVDQWYKRCFGDVGETELEKSENSESSSSHQLPSSPPPVLSPEPICKENIDPCSLLPETPIPVPAQKKRKIGFMMADLLQLSPQKE